ncbi:Uma2 family endonuclease [Armatimonas rosea]|uniref:Uma2 family endonuclease n=1 Tax=Armatimonas rosea TaxID=685828 RepID=A0A7W9W5P0_ARMRO|nr:Uma2 family endonuclease [Armatimonas rosea]MBB6049773.1 Uma2 family endonuclease [Armatimonas rosea]
MIQTIPTLYPESDGQPMADNTQQFQWIARLKGGFEFVTAHDPLAFVAGDLLWYPVQGQPQTRLAPDVLVVFGRPKGHRGSYKQWEEDNIAPQVVVEILSPGNTVIEMSRKQGFYERYGVDEYYLYDPTLNEAEGWLREAGGLRRIESMDGWTSPRLGVRFAFVEGSFTVFGPDGRAFEDYETILAARNSAEARATAEHERAERLAAKLRELGIEPE